MFFSFNKTRLQSPPKILFVCDAIDPLNIGKSRKSVFEVKIVFCFVFHGQDQKYLFFVKMGERPKMDFELFGHLPEKD